LDIGKEEMMKKGGEINKRLKKARQSIGMTLKEAAKLAGFKHYQTLAKIEKAERAVKAVELAKLSNVYARDINFFLTTKPQNLTFNINWRKTKEKLNLKKDRERLKTLLQRFILLRDRLGLKENTSPLPFIDKKQLSYELAAKYGEDYAQLLILGNRPALTLSTILENEKNIPIFYLELPEGTSGATISSNSISAICINANEAPWRKNFDLAHELFHLIYPYKKASKCGLNETTNVEKWANAFASALLLPGDEIQDFINIYRKEKKIPIINIMMEAKNFGVSTAAFLWRLVNLGWLKREDVKKLLQSELIKKEDRKLRSEISWESSYLSHQFILMIFKAISKGLLSRARAAEYLYVNIAELDSIFLKEGFDPDEDYSAEVSIT
jgi:Zn-dependent peptidase ImmA (M78 family)/DNA-binding XRE family transcriptional regulator